MRPPESTSPEFDRVLAGAAEPDLARVALEIARDFQPDLDVEAYLARIDALATRIRARRREGASPRKVLGQINWVLYVEEGYVGNTDDYFDARNSFLNEVVDRKTGIPISLSVLYQAIAGRLGVTLSPVNSPAHFLLRLDDGETTFIDPFHSGDLLDREACERRIVEVAGRPLMHAEARLSPCSAATVVARMLRNLKAVFVGQEDFASAYIVQRRLALVAEDPLERRDLGMLCLQLDRPGEAIDPLAAYLKSRPKADDAETVQTLLSNARAIIAQWN